MRLDVLRLEPGAGPQHSPRGQPVRLRATYEQSNAALRTDSFDSQAAALEQQYRRLAGHSLEFTLDGEGRLGDLEGLRQILPDERAAGAVRAWLSSLASAAALAPRGIAIGEKWSGEQPLTSAPLAGLLLRTRSSYLRDEPCRPPALAGLPGAAGAATGEMCAVVVTETRTDRRHAPRDPTPAVYLREGLRTRGWWNSSGESLSYISLRTGWVVSVTGTDREEMDVTVATADGSSSIRYTGRLDSASQITLLEDLPAGSR